MMNTIEKRFRVNRGLIGFLKFIIEAYEGMAMVTTRNARTGEISIFVAPGCESDMDALIQELGKSIFIQPMALNQETGSQSQS
ncbi:MAG TPA: DUF4911 domain-containing protein [Desulfatirhabdiaceae bacterium]|nr:DUF4911 domain-containing protein [Desulfatirhabdiaceae bacterium]